MYVRMMAASVSRIVLLVCVWIPGCTCSGTGSPPNTYAARRIKNNGWQTFRGKEYLFVLDSGLLLDKNRNQAKKDCESHGGDLVSLDTEEEFEYVKDQIRARVRLLGTQLLTEQWWTNGMSYKQIKWIWDTPQMPDIRISALKRSSVPRNGPSYLALSHPGGWRLKVAPKNFEMRYVCERNKTIGIPPIPSSAYSPTQANYSESMLNEISENLRRQLFSTYDAKKAPIYSSDSDLIDLKINLLQIKDNVTQNILFIGQHVVTEWTDPRLSWNPVNYGGMTYLRTSKNQIWYPDLSYPRRNGLPNTCRNSSPQVLVTINASGRITLERTCDVTYNCSLRKSSAFPFDHQYCRLLLETDCAGASVKVSWGHKNGGDEDAGFDQAWRVSSLSGEELKSRNADAPRDSSPSCLVDVKLYLHRNVIYHVLTLLVPCVFLTVVLLILLWLPHGSGVKCVATFLVTLAFLLYLLIGGQHRLGHVSFSDMFMIVMSIIGTLALVTQICILRLIRRHQKHLPPPPWVEKVVMNRTQKSAEKIFKESKYKESRVIKKQDMLMDKCLANSKWNEEKELMLGDQTLGMTSLGRDAKMRTPSNQYVTHPRDPVTEGYTNKLATNNRTTLYNPPQNGTVKKQQTPYPQGQITSRYQKPFQFKETALYSSTKGSDHYSEEARDVAGVSAGESFDSGCHSATKNSPDITMSTTQSIKESQWKKCIMWFDRAVSLVISAAVIFAIMIFTILFLAT